MKTICRSVLTSLALAAVVFLCCNEAQADLVQPNVSVDNPLAFTGTLNVTQFTQATYSFSSVNWSVRVREDFIGSEALPNDFEIIAQHLVTPDQGGSAPNPLSLSLVLFANSMAPGGPQRGPFTVFVVHDATVDFLRVTYRPIGTGQSQLLIETGHGSGPTSVPEPNALMLLGTGISLLGSWKLRRKKLRLRER